MSIISPVTITYQSSPHNHPLQMLISRTSFAAAQFLTTTTPSLLRRHHHHHLSKPIKPISSIPPKSPSKMSISTTSAPSSATQFIEHIVLFKIKPEIPQSKITSMLTSLNNLLSLPTVLHLSAGPILRHRSSSLSFTHILHSRYLTKSDYASYSDHPSHLSVVADYVKPIVSDIMAVDWVAEGGAGLVVPPPGSALRVTFLKLKEGEKEGEGKEEVLEVIGGIKEKFRGVEQLTFGENFSMARGKGFGIGSIAVFKGVGELDALGEEAELANVEKDKVRGLLDEVLVVDYVVPSSQSASL